MIQLIENTVNLLRSKKPLVLNLTNYVTMDFMANGLLALGAAPLMSVCDDELEDLIKIADTVNMNIGTLDHALISRCKKAAILAKQQGKPVILDPVGSGASPIRTQVSRELMVYADIIRGNASEIMSLSDLSSTTFGVESMHTSDQATTQARALAQQLSATLIVSGEKDFITDGVNEEVLHYGSALMPLVTGMGCLLTAVVAAFRAVIDDPFEAARIATAYYGLCGNIAGRATQHPGTFRMAFIDALYLADRDAMEPFYGRQH